MSDEHRRQTIVQMLEEAPFISVAAISAATGVSAATARRDIDKLGTAGHAQKVHGGIAALTNTAQVRSVALPFMLNRDIAVAEKSAIAKAAGQLVRDGSMIIIHGGSTCFHFGKHIADRNVRVFTTSMPLAAYLAEYGTCQLTVGGGDLHREPGILFDPSRVNPPFYASQFFVGSLGVSADGLLESHPLLVSFVNEMCALSNEIIVLVDSRKFVERPPTVALPLNKVTKLITDEGISDKAAKMLEDQGVEYIVAKTEKTA